MRQVTAHYIGCEGLTVDDLPIFCMRSKGRSTLAREPVVEAGVSCSNQIQENHEILQ